MKSKKRIGISAHSWKFDEMTIEVANYKDVQNFINSETRQIKQLCLFINRLFQKKYFHKLKPLKIQIGYYGDDFIKNRKTIILSQIL